MGDEDGARTCCLSKLAGRGGGAAAACSSAAASCVLSSIRELSV
jgi:hypothetical protein